MTERAESRSENAKAKVADGSILSQLVTIASLLRGSGTGARVVLLGLGLVSVIGATAYGQVELNAWNQPFYDAIIRRDISGFSLQLGVFTIIACGLLVLNVTQTWLNQTMKLELRQGVTRDLFAQWLSPKRAFLLASAGEVGVNPDQRIHEDARHFTELSTDLGVGLFQAALLLASFIGVLWRLSADATFEWRGSSFAIPGYMVWAALLYAGAASFVTWRVGRPLVGLNAERYARESDLRFALVRVNQNSDSVAVYRGEKPERRRLEAEFDRLLAVVRRLVGATTRLAWVTAGYGWFTIVAPVIVAAPAYFAGNLTFGGLLMAVGAFTQVQQSLRWFVDNASLIADWRATLLRVGEFRHTLLELDHVGKGVGHIRRADGDRRIVLDDVSVLLPSGRSSLSESHVDVGPGDHVVIVGGPRSGKTCLFRATAGLWPWGTGRIELPLEAAMFIPKHPYIPGGSLREVLAYPLSPDAFAESDFAVALTRMGLGHLAPALRDIAPWEKELAAAEQQNLAFARLLLHKPRCVVVATAIDTLTDDARKILFDIFETELSATALLVISGLDETFGFYDRKLNLNLQTGGRRLDPALFSGRATPARTPASPQAAT